MRSRIIFVTIGLLAFGASAYADGISLDYFLRFNGARSSWSYFWIVVCGIMVANYLLNFAVIGLPAILLGSANLRVVSVGLLVLTFLGQIADKIGAFVALFLSVPLSALFSKFIHSDVPGLGNPAFVYALFASNLICSGIAVGCLALWFCGRTGLTKSLSRKIAVAAAILTNPAWVLLLPWWR